MCGWLILRLYSVILIFNHDLHNPLSLNCFLHHTALPLSLGLGCHRSWQFAVHADSHLVCLQEKYVFKVPKGQIPEAVSFRFEDQRPGMNQQCLVVLLYKSMFQLCQGIRAGSEFQPEQFDSPSKVVMNLKPVSTLLCKQLWRTRTQQRVMHTSDNQVSYENVIKNYMLLKKGVRMHGQEYGNIDQTIIDRLSMVFLQNVRTVQVHRLQLLPQVHLHLLHRWWQNLLVSSWSLVHNRPVVHFNRVRY